MLNPYLLFNREKLLEWTDLLTPICIFILFGLVLFLAGKTLVFAYWLGTLLNLVRDFASTVGYGTVVVINFSIYVLFACLTIS